MEVTASGQKDFAASTEMISVTMLGKRSDKLRDTFGVETKHAPFRKFHR